MPKGDRRGKHKTRLIVAASVAAAALILALVAVGFVYQSGYYQYAADQNRQYARDTEQKIGQACRGVVIDQRPKCLTEAHIEAAPEQRAYEHDQADLIAQRKAALWAEMMGIAALLGMGLSIVGVALVYVTFKATREAAESSRDTLASYLAKERAILSAGRALFNHQTGNRHANGFKVKLTNIGASAAHIESVAWAYLSNGMNVWPARITVTDYHPIVIAPGASEQTRHLGVVKFPSEPFWLVGTVEYSTLATSRFQCHFCYKVMMQEGGGYGPDSWVAEPDRVSGMPRNG